MKKILLGLLIVLVALLLVANFMLGSVVKAAAEKIGPSVVGVPVKLEKASFSLLRGHVSLKGFSLGNPAGFKTDQAIGVGEVTVDLEPKSIFSDTIVIKRIYVNAPQINYEIGLGNSNIGAILDGLQKGEPSAPKTEEPKAEEKPGKKVVIEDLLVEHGEVKIAAKLTAGIGAPIPLPTVHLTNIGKDEGGASIVDVIRKVFGAIFSAITDVVTGAGKLAVEGVTAVGGAAVEGATAVGGAAVKGAEAVGGAAVDGVKAFGGALKGVFGGEKEEPAKKE